MIQKATALEKAVTLAHMLARNSPIAAQSCLATLRHDKVRIVFELLLCVSRI